MTPLISKKILKIPGATIIFGYASPLLGPGGCHIGQGGLGQAGPTQNIEKHVENTSLNHIFDLFPPSWAILGPSPPPGPSWAHAWAQGGPILSHPGPKPWAQAPRSPHPPTPLTLLYPSQYILTGQQLMVLVLTNNRVKQGVKPYGFKGS